MMVSLFSGISTFRGLFNTKAILVEESSSGTIAREIRIHTVPKGISPKVNLIVWVEFELTYYDVVVQYVNHNAIGTLPSQLNAQSCV